MTSPSAEKFVALDDDGDERNTKQGHNYRYRAFVGIILVAVTLAVALPLGIAANKDSSSSSDETMADFTRHPTADIQRLESDNTRFTGIVIHEDTVYIAGQIGFDFGAPPDAIVSIEDQTRIALAKIDALLDQAGTDKSKLLWAQIWLKDIARDSAAMDGVYTAWLDQENKPVRALLSAGFSNPSFLVEIMVTAALPGADIIRLGSNDKFSTTVTYKDTVYIAGQIGVDDFGAPLEDQVVGNQTRSTLAKIDVLLGEAGTDKSNLLSAQIWLNNITRDWDAMDEVWYEWIDQENKPVRALVECALASPKILVEIMVIAALPSTDIERLGLDNPRLSQAVIHKDTVYIAGQFGANFTAPLEDQVVEDQTTSTLAKIDEYFRQARTDKSKLLSAQIWLSELRRDNAAVDGVWAEWIDQENKPVRTRVQSALARPIILVEIMVIAALGPSASQPEVMVSFPT